jgi:uncharacterized membrane protein
MADINKFFSKSEQDAIVKAIKTAEHNTSGEIRVHIETHVNKSETLDRATEVFHMLDMHKTAARNGVLFYLAIADKAFAIIGDEGIHAAVPKDFWHAVKDTVISHFKKDNFAEGLTSGIILAGEKLKQFFPLQSDDKNELSDTISVGN